MIVAAAIKQDGVVYSLPAPARHHDIIHYMVDTKGLEKPIFGEQGFIDSEHGFVMRGAAATLALLEEQVESLRWPPKLYSEDLW